MSDPQAMRCEACGVPVGAGLCEGCKDISKERLAVRCREKYELLIEPLRAVAKTHGYALTVHGSVARDIDLVAVPWIDSVDSVEDLVAGLLFEIERVNGFALVRNDGAEGDYTRRNPQPKPHGRLAWSIHLGGGPYIDLSVMPRDATALKLVHLQALAPGDQLEVVAQHLHRQETVAFDPHAGRPASADPERDR